MPTRLLHLLLTVALVLGTLGLLLGAGFWAVGLATGQPLQTTLSVASDAPARTVPVLDESGRAVGKMVFDRGQLELSTGSAGHRLFQGLDLLVGGGLWLAMLWLLRRLVGAIGAGMPFAAANVRRLRLLGGALVLLALWRMASEVGAQIILLRQIAPGDRGTLLLSSLSAGTAGKESVRIDLTLDPSLFLVGLGVLALAEAFRIGATLREENAGSP